jgi:dihydrofolate reductase
MRRIVTFTSVTLDGVMQAPGRADEDTRGGFQHGGWAARYADSVTAGFASQNMAKTRGLLFGRRTYEDFFSFWPKQKDNMFTEVLNQSPKYVASNTLQEPLDWSNSTLLNGDVMEAVGRLREEADGDLVVLGSGQLVRSLISHDLIDEYILLIHPLILGSGRRLFAEDGTLAALKLRDVKPTTTGVLIATYRPARD